MLDMVEHDLSLAVGKDNDVLSCRNFALQEVAGNGQSVLIEDNY